MVGNILYSFIVVGNLETWTTYLYRWFYFWNQNVFACCSLKRLLGRFHHNLSLICGSPPWISRQGFDHHHAAFERQSHVMVRTVVLSTQQPPGFHWSKPRGTVLHRLWRMLQWQVMCDSVDSVHVDFRFASQRKRVQKKGGKKNISSVRWVSSRVQRQNLTPGCWFTMFELFLDGLIFQFLQVWCSIQICSFEPCSFLF